MKKLGKLNLEALRNEMPVLSKTEERGVVGGEEYSYFMFEYLLERGEWKGGYVIGLGYVLPEVVIYGYQSSGGQNQPCNCQGCNNYEQYNNPSSSHQPVQTPLGTWIWLNFIVKHDSCCPYYRN